MGVYWTSVAPPLLLLLLSSQAAGSWVESPSSRADANAKLAGPAVKPPLYTVDLDEPASTRWNRIAAQYSVCGSSNPTLLGRVEVR